MVHLRAELQPTAGFPVEGFRAFALQDERERERDVYICMYTHIQGAALIFLGFFCLVG